MPSTYFRLVLRELGGSAACGETGAEHIAAETAMIDVGRQLEQVRTLNRLQDPGWGLRMGALFGASAHGPVGVAVNSAEDLARACKVLIRFGHVRTPFIALRERNDGDWFGIVVAPAMALPPAELQPLMESTMVGMTALLEQVLGRPAHGVQYELAHPRPAHADDYTEYLPGPVRFEAGESCMLLPRPWLTIRSPFADPALYQAVVHRLEAQARELHPDGLFISQVEQIMAASGDRPPALDNVAAALHLSSRTVERRLCRVGTTFRALADAHRRERAQELLRDPDWTLAEIGARLGYDDPANFGRACRRWFGAAPGTVRRGLASVS